MCTWVAKGELLLIYFKNNFIYLFIYLFIYAVLGVHCCMGFSLVAGRGNYSLVVGLVLGVWDSHCCGFSCCGACAWACKLGHGD